MISARARPCRGCCGDLGGFVISIAGLSLRTRSRCANVNKWRNAPTQFSGITAIRVHPFFMVLHNIFSERFKIRQRDINHTAIIEHVSKPNMCFTYRRVCINTDLTSSELFMYPTVPEECYFAHRQNCVRSASKHLYEVEADLVSIEVDVACDR